MLPQGWPDVLWGDVVAVDGAMVAVQFERPGQLPGRPEHMLVPISDQEGIIGDGVVAARLGDILVCRFFPRPAASGKRASLGDRASLDEYTRPAKPE